MSILSTLELARQRSYFIFLLVIVFMFFCINSVSANSNDGILVQINSTHWYFQTTQTNLSDGTYNYSVYVQDIVGNVNDVIKRYITIQQNYTIANCTGYVSGSDIYTGNCNNLTALNNSIRNPAILQNQGSGIWLLNANLTNDAGNIFYLNETDVTWLKINSTHTATGNSFWYYFSQGKTEIANTKITSWNTTIGTVESIATSSWGRSAVYSDGTSSNMNISNSNLSYLGYSAENMYGVGIANSSGNVITGNIFLNNYVGLIFFNSSKNIITGNTATSNIGYGLMLYDNSNNNTFSDNIGVAGSTLPGILVYLSNGNILNNNTGSSNGGTGFLLQQSYDNKIIGGNYSSANTYALYLSQAYSNNTFNGSVFPTGSIYFGTVDSIFEYDNGAGVWLKTQIISPASTTGTIRSIIKWYPYKITWSETWLASRQIQYNVTGLLPNRDYRIYNGTTIEYNYTSDANGTITPFIIGFTTEVKTVSVSMTNLTVNGYVQNNIGIYLQNARIDFNGNYVFTDVAGYYEFTGIEGGTYQVLGRAIGYRNHTEMLDIEGDVTKNITLNEKTFGTVTTPGFSAISGIFIIAVTLILLRTKTKRRD